MTQFPDVVFFDVMLADAGYYPVEAGVCDQWAQQHSLTHPVLRDHGEQDPTSAVKLLFLEIEDVLVLDRQLTITHRGRVTDGLAQKELLDALQELP